MAEFFQLSTAERLEALSVAANASGLLPHLLEKDLWVVWSLRQLFTGPHADHLVFKGGTSLSKAYRVIRRFSEDVDLTYDIRAIARDLVGDADTPLPTSKSQEKKWSKEIRARLSDWVAAEIVPRLKYDLEQHGLPATVRSECEKVFIDYTPLTTGTGYIAPAVMLEFGARLTGEPSEPRTIHCDAAEHLQSVEFPAATPRVMRPERALGENVIETVINKSEKVKDRKNKAKEKKQLSAAEKEYKSKRKLIQEKLIKFATRIPAFMYLTDFRENTLQDVITKLESHLFRTVTGLTVQDFHLPVRLKVFNTEQMNQAVFAFRRYEDASLRYTGIESHVGLTHFGPYDTVVAKEADPAPYI